MSYSMHKGLLEGTAPVDALSPDKHTLVTATSSHLHIHSLNPATLQIHRSISFPLQATIKSINHINILSKTYLLLAFPDAKMSIVEYDAQLESLETISLHYYEKDEFRRQLTNTQYLHKPTILVHPSNRAIVLWFYTDFLAVILIDQDGKPEPSFVLHIPSISPHINTPKSIVFLNAFIHPTIAILYSSQQTWTGRLAAKSSTDALIVVSLSNNPTILYKADNLPYNCSELIPCPELVGGVLVVSSNAIIHVDQTSIPGVVAVVNGYWGYKEETYHPTQVTNFAHLSICLDSASILFISPDTCLCILTTGHSYLITLNGKQGSGVGKHRKLPGVKNFSITDLGIQLPIGPVCSAGDWCFVGTDILEIHIDEVVQENEVEDDDDEDLDALYSSTKKKLVSRIIKYGFRRASTITSFAPVRTLVHGIPHNYSEYPFARPTNLELVGGTGFGDICVFQQSVRPHIVYSRGEKDVNGIWWIGGRIVVGKADGCIVIKTTNELEQTDDGDFMRTSPTILVSQIKELAGSILQVYEKGILLLDSQYTKQTSLETPKTIQATLAFPYLQLLHRNGDCTFYTLDSTSITLIKKIPKIQCATIYAGKLSTIGEALEDPAFKACTYRTVKRIVEEKPAKSFEQADKIENPGFYDEDDLYGGGGSMGNVVDVIEEVVEDDDEMVIDDVEIEEEEGGDDGEGYCLLVKENGNLEIFKLPSFKLCFSVIGFTSSPTTLFDKSFSNDGDEDSQSKKGDFMREILMVDIDECCYLFARNNHEDFFIYKLYNYLTLDLDPNGNPNNTHILAIRFQKIQHQHISRPLDPTKRPDLRRKIITFNHIGDGGNAYTGVFLTGKRPCFVMLAKESNEKLSQVPIISDNGVMREPGFVGSKRVLRVHPCFVDGEVYGFTEFNHGECRNGFVYFNSNGQLRFAQLQPQFKYDLALPYCKVNLGRTLDKLSYHQDSETYIAATFTDVPFDLERAKYAAALAAGVIDEADGEGKPNLEVKGEGMYSPVVGGYNLELVSPVTWETVDVLKLEEYEQVLCMGSVLLESKQSMTGKKLFLAVGTGIFRGEDLATRGRMLIFDIIDVVPEKDNPQTNHKLKLLYASEEKSPVSALCDINGYLLAAIGSKIIIHEFDDSQDLTGIAFLDVNVYVTSVCVVKNLVFVGDMVKSVCLLGFQEEPPKLTLVAKDFSPLSVYATNCIVGDDNLSFLVGDDEKNLHVMQFNPYNVHSVGGMRLIRKGDIHIGSDVQSLLRLKRVDRNTNDQSRQHFSICSTLDGGISIVTPVDEKTYKRLYALYSKMVNQLEHYAGLNPRAFRQVQMKNKPVVSSDFGGLPGPKSVLDGDTLYRYLHLSRKGQHELAVSIGTNADLIIKDILQLVSGIEYF